jgi:DNA-binding LytR/AlgR family response regulator
MHPDIRETTPPVRERPARAAGASRTAARTLARAALMSVAVGAFMAAVGAFGSGDAPAASRYAYWIGVMVVGAVGYWGVSNLIGEARFASRPLAMSALMVALATPPMTVFVWLTTAWTFGFLATLHGLIWFFAPVLLVSVAMTTLSYFVHRQATWTHAAAQGAPPPRFLDRLPLKLRGADLYAISAEDHYLRLHTSRGSDLILMRLSDAIAELEGIEGARTHRSWWVARDAVVDVARGDGRAMLKLKGGVEAPVSRTHARGLRQARWW